MRPIILLLCFLCSVYLKAQTIQTELFANNFTSPLDIQNAGDSRLFVVEQAGVIKILNADGSTNVTPFLNITSQVSSGGERGLLGLAFHPNYSSNGYFYVNYTNNSGATQISRFSVNSSNPNIADSTSELSLLTISQPYSNHNGGCIRFGPDGYLYIGTGDGGSGGDPGNRSQNLSSLLGKMLRIDVDNTTTSPALNYAIPSDNPFVGNTSAENEIWAYGLRNPWRFSFDMTSNNLWIGDVGQNSTEEINRVASNLSGLNYGWRCYEGSNTYNTSGCPSSSTMTFPVAEYPIPPCFCNVIGGYVYRGSVYSDIQGIYIYATFGNGVISSLDSSDNITNHGDFGGDWVGFGEDVNKELYIVDLNGSIYKIKGGQLSVPEFSLSSVVSISPNPTNNYFKVSIENTIINAITIVDLKGRVIYSENNLTTSQKEINLNEANTGFYFVNIKTQNNNSITKKLILK